MLTFSPLILKPDPSRTVIRPFSPSDPDGFVDPACPRVQRIVDRVVSLDHDQMCDELEQMTRSLDERHRDVEEMLLRRFDEIKDQLVRTPAIDRDRQLLIGAYFSEEYSFEAAALFNPSMILHPRQDEEASGAIRFALSLRGIGEGHISSVTFRTGRWSAADGFAIDPPSAQAVTPRIDNSAADEAHGATRIICDGSRDVSESVLFPVTQSQRQGIEDLRLVRFTEDDGTMSVIGTYTAFDGANARTELLRATDLRTFLMSPLEGSVARSKGMALFPRKVGGRYMALGRQDSENIWLIASDDIGRWNDGVKLLTPQAPWEFVQVGNCGSPIELDEGWLVLTHGVGMARNYCMGACLLDKDDPSKLLARTRKPILEPSPKARDGYVPNVVYSCGAIVHDRTLLLPYGVADNFTSFASAAVGDVLAAMD